MKRIFKLTLLITAFAVLPLALSKPSVAQESEQNVIYCEEAFDWAGQWCKTLCVQQGCECDAGWFYSTCCCSSAT